MKNINIKKVLYSLIIITIFLVALYLRLKAAIIRPVIFDEAFTITYLAKFDQISEIILADASVPPLQYLLIKLMSHVSTNILWLRIPSVIFSMLGLWLSYKFATKFSKKVALLTLLVLGISTFQLFFAWQAYVYAQLFFLGTSTIYLFFHLLTKQNVKNENLKAWLLFFLGTMAFLTHYGFIWTICGMSFILLQELISTKFSLKKIKRTQQKLLFANLGIYLFLGIYSPILINNFQQALKNISWFEPINIYSIGESFSNLLGFFDQLGYNIFLDGNLSKVIATVILFFLIIHLTKLNNRRINYLIYISVINLIMPILISFLIKRNIFATRAIITASCTFTILFAIFVDNLFKRKYYYLLLGFFSIFYLYFFQITNRNFYNNSQEFDLVKQYVEWFRKNPEYLRNNSKIFIYNTNQPIFPSDIRLNYYVLNYYWYGYDGKDPLPNYDKIKNSEDVQREKFYLLKISIFDEEEDKIATLCPNKKKLQISNSSKETKLASDLYYQYPLANYIYECNSK